MAILRRCPMILLLALLSACAGPASATDLTMWAQVDAQRNYWLQPEADPPAEPFPGTYCSVEGQNGTPCAAVADPIVWEMPLRLPGALALDPARQVVMRAFLGARPCDPVGDAGCRPDLLAAFSVQAALVRGNETLLDGGTRNVTLNGEVAEVVWLAPSNGTALDPATGPVAWRVTLLPKAGAANAAFIGMAEGAWSSVTLPVLPPPAAAQAPQTVTHTLTDTRTITASVTVTAVQTVAARETVTFQASEGGKASMPAAGFAALGAVLLLAGAVRRRL